MVSSKMTTRKQRGERAEALVADHYQSLGYRVLDRNWSCRGGEIDLVVANDEVLAFVEVRSVTTGFLRGAEVTVTPAKQGRVALAAELWLGQQSGIDADIRFDVVSVRFRRLLSPRLERFENAFTPPWAV